MIHALVWWVFVNVMRFIFNIPSEIDSEGKASLAIENIIFADLIVVFGIGIVIFIAHFSYKYVETRFNRII